jgi:hypothetical protein
MDPSDDPKIRQLRLAVHDTLAALDELMMALRLAYRTPDALAAEDLTQRLLHSERIQHGTPKSVTDTPQTDSTEE